MKLTGLNIDCLENILEYLELEDLLSAASSNKRLNKAAKFIFNREHSKKIVKFYILLSKDQLNEIDNTSIFIRDLKISLQFVRCFGHLVSNIQYSYSFSCHFEFNQRVLTYINEYCSDSLIRMEIHDGHTYWQQLEKPFSKVQIVTLDNCFVTDKGTFNKLFPQMVQLNYDSPYSDHSIFANANSFFNLKTLNVSDSDPWGKIIYGDAVAPILRLNSQLEEINFELGSLLLESSDFQEAIKAMTNLRKLSFDEQPLYSDSFQSIVRIDTVKEFRKCFDKDLTTEIPFLFVQLETLYMKFYTELDTKFFKFIKKHPTIQNLTLKAKNLGAKNLFTIAKSLPLLKKIKFSQFKIPADEAINFMAKFPNLEVFTFSLDGYDDDFDGFQADLGKDWDCKKAGDSKITVKRLCPLANKCKK